MKTGCHILVLCICAALVGCGQPPIAPQSHPSDAVAHDPAELPSDTEFVGKVVKIVDGDTIDVQVSAAARTRVRLNGIDAPERGQPFGRNATETLKESIAGQLVTIRSHGEDRDGRTLGDVFFDEQLINLSLVKVGLAWHNTQYAPDRTDLAEAERMARELQTGLWSGSHQPIPPWDWREMSKDERDEYR